ncbi:MAG: hypothetical protein ACK53X_07090 [Holosporales bacterium]
MNAGATTDDQLAGGSSWFSWLSGNKTPKKPTNNSGAEATPSNKMATYIGVTLGVVLCGAALATGLSWLLLLAGGRPIAGIVIDKTTRQKEQDRGAVQPEQTPEPEERKTSPSDTLVGPDGFFKILEEQGLVLSEAQKEALQKKFPDGAPMEAWLEEAKPFFEPQQNSPSSSLSPEDKGSQLDEPVPVEPRPAEVEPSLLSATHELETDKPPAESTVTNQNQLGTLTDYHNINRQLSAENN